MSNLASGLGSYVQNQPNFGTDLSGIFDLDPNMSETSGLHGLGQALARRISTPRGTLISDPNYGIDVTGEVGDDLSPADISKMGAQIDAEFKKDERVFTSTTTVTFSANGSLTINALVTPAGGPTFKLTIVPPNQPTPANIQIGT